MPMFDVRLEEQGVRTRCFRVRAKDADDAVESVWEDGLEPDLETFKQHDGNTFVTKLKDCDCGICRTRYPWACQDADPEDDVLDLGSTERAWE